MLERPEHRLSRGARRAIASAVAVLALVGAGLVAASPAATVPQVPCDQVDTFVWDGIGGDEGDVAGDGFSWSDANNWDTDCVPGERFPVRDYEDHVTIPDGFDVTLGDGTSAHVRTLINNGSLTVDLATLETRENSRSHTLKLSDGFLVGRAQLKVTALLEVNRSAQASRRCGFVEVDCSNPVAPEVGTTVIAPGARMVLKGYLNLDDQRVIDNRGTVTLSQGTDGRIAADDGTLFRNRGSFRILNDGGYYQGDTPVGELKRSQFLNTGTVKKSSPSPPGSDLSVVDARFRNSDPNVTGTGVVRVQSGILNVASLGSTAVRQAVVGADATLGNGGPEDCNVITGANCDLVVPTADDQSVTTVQVPQATPVSITELQDAPSAGFLTAPVEIETPDANATPSDPLTFTILIDASALGANTPLEVAQESPIHRKGSTTPWAKLPKCNTTTQLPTPSKPTCVARTDSVATTNELGGGDAAIVIKSLQNSRYRVGA
jgi:hypothetical protein